MESSAQSSLLQKANVAFQHRDYEKALELYQQLKNRGSALGDALNFNISLCIQELTALGREIPITENSNQNLSETSSATTPNTKQITKPVDKALNLNEKLYEALDSTNKHTGAGEALTTVAIINATNFDKRFANEALHKISTSRHSFHTYIICEAPHREELNRPNRTGKVTIIEPAFPGKPISSLIQFLRDNNIAEYDLACLIQNLTPNTSHGESEHLASFTVLQANELLGSDSVVSKIKSSFNTNASLTHIGSASAFKSKTIHPSDLQFQISNAAIDYLNISDPTQSSGFFSGACFWTRASMLQHVWTKPSAHLNVKIPGQVEDLNTYEAITEVLLSFTPSYKKNTVALLYSLNQENTEATLVYIENTRIPSGSTYPVSMGLKAYQQLNADIKIIDSHFSTKFYKKSYPYLSRLNMATDYHYLRFGANEGFNPNENFSSAWHWNLHDRKPGNICHNVYISYLLDPDNKKICLPAQENLPAITKIVSESLLFDEQYYIEIYQDVANSKFRPINHYIKHGWKEGRLPSRSTSFDSLWYGATYLKEWDAKIDPILHYSLVGARKNLLKRPALSKPNKSNRFKKGQEVRRVCLFAGYDAHGKVDDYVIDLITELSRHSDVFYLADCSIAPNELTKLNDITKKAWAFRHGEYDFGSYSRLAIHLVGWKTLQEYDEVLLVNDSGYLLTSLDAVFEKMSRKKCDWWGLQATKGIAATRRAPSNQFDEKLPMDYVLERLLSEFEKDDCYDFHIGSYFLAFRKPTLEKNGALFNLLSSVSKEKNKRNIVLKYEIGLTRSMLLSGHRPATFIDDLYPFHPIYTNNHFHLVAEGFPFFKRYLLTENHYQIPDLRNWKTRISAILPSINLSKAENNLRRVSDAEKLYKTLNIPPYGSKWPAPLLTDEEFLKEDIVTPKDNYTWAFPVCAFDHSFGGNERMIYENIKFDKTIRKVILTRSKHIEVEGENVVQVPLRSREGQQLLMESVYIFIKHTPWRNAIYPLNPNLHRFINLWHGIPLKRIGYTSLDMAGNLEALAKEHDKCHAVIASSKIDRLAMATAFYPLSYHDIWLTGLPRNDVILRDEYQLPVDFINQLEALRSNLQGRRLVMYAPTFRNGQDASTYQFSPAEIQDLADCLNKHNAVLGIREHMAAKNDSYWMKLKDTNIPLLDLSRSNYADIELLYREAETLITDYSSCFIDYILTGKPEICFAYDYEAYAQTERGLFYELKDVFPGPICSDADALIHALDVTLSGDLIEGKESYAGKQKIFFDYIDDSNSSRVINMIKSEILENAPSRKRLHHNVGANQF